MTLEQRVGRFGVVAGGITAGTGLLELVRTITGRVFIPNGVPDARLMEEWVAASVLLIGLGLIGAITGRTTSVRRSALGAAIAVVVATLLSLATHAAVSSRPANPFFGALYATRVLGGATLLVAGVALLLTAAGRGREVANSLALMLVALGGTVVLSFAYGGRLFLQIEWPQVSAAAAISSLFIGAGILAANGTGAWPIRHLVGESVPAMLLRWILPAAVLSILVTDAAMVYLFQGISPALGSALNTVFSIGVVALVVSYVGDVIGGRLDRSYAAVRYSEDKFSRVFTSTPAGILLSRLSDGKLIDVNNEFLRAYGYAREDVIGRTAVELGMWEDESQRAQLVAAVSQHGDVREMDLNHRARDGRQIVARTSAQVIELQGEQILVASFVDITTRIRAEQELKRAEAEFRELFNGVRDVVFTATPEGRLTMLNAAFERLTGLQSEEWVGRPVFDLVHPDDQARARVELAAAIAGVSREGPPLRLQTARGYRFAEIMTTPRIEDGRIVGMFGIARDVSERVNLQEQLQQSQKMDAVGRLAGGIAHDFNNLLTVIIGSGELVLATSDRSRPEAMDVAEMVKAGQRAAEMTRQLLAFSRRQVIEPRDVNLNDVLRNIEKMLRRMIGDDMKVTTTGAPDLGIVRADPGQLEQVITNLAVNARDAMPTGGTITMSTSNIVLTGAENPAAHAGAYVRLRVADTGTGMTAETRARIFEPFFTTKELGKGTGLGLSTVFGIVQQAGGFVEVDSELGRGTTFNIFLPQTVAAAQDYAHDGGPIRSFAGTETVLIAEDNEELRTLTARILRGLGHTVLTAPTGVEALSLAERHTGVIDLLVTDVVMPGMNGRALANGLSRVRPGLRVLYLSGYTDDILSRHGVLEPGLHLLSKPYTPATLSEKVREVLDAPAAQPAVNSSA